MKVIRLNENDIKNLVKKILKEERKSGTSNDIFPEVPDELIDRLTRGNEFFMNRIIVKIKGPNAGWYDYNKGLYSRYPEWWGPYRYTENGMDATEKVIFDQDVIERSERDRTSREFKKWLIVNGIDVEEVYLGET